MRDLINYVFVGVVVSFAFWFGYHTGQIQKEQEVRPLPSLEMIQEWIGLEGDDVDGKYGPKTKAKWNLAIMNQYAERSYE